MKLIYQKEFETVEELNSFVAHVEGKDVPVTPASATLTPKKGKGKKADVEVAAPTEPIFNSTIPAIGQIPAQGPGPVNTNPFAGQQPMANPFTAPAAPQAPAQPAAPTFSAPAPATPAACRRGCACRAAHPGRALPVGRGSLQD